MSARKQTSRKSTQSAVSVKISRTLHRARMNKNYSLNELHRITKIKLSYLKAIDSGEFKKVPEGFYLRAFIKKFADTVGINGTELLRRYNNELPDLQDPHYMNKVSEDKLLVRANKERIEDRHSTVRKYIPLFVMILVVLVVLISIWVVASHYHNGFTSDSGGHSTAMSENSSIKEAKRRKVYDHKHPLVIESATKHGKTLVYPASLKVPAPRITFDSPAEAHLTFRGRKKVLKRSKLEPNQKKSFKIQKRDKSIRVVLTTRDRVRLKTHHHIKRLNSKRSVKTLILKFSK